ncbi:unnamed protein product [Caenorhabditis angaria]|uniref:Uncharacterized protein n=1 Tax=Caenorhabditis angaria TaxID=860376 RepID=A0A9P1I4Z3_9PELO|nr:unnamed protein product [Caenorhabditis angaria]
MSSDSIPAVSSYFLTNLTYTPMSYRDRITVEFGLNFTSWFLNFLLFLFVKFKRNIWNSLKSTIVFVTTGSLLVNIPLILFQFWMVINLQLGNEPMYTVFTCSFFKNFCSSTTSAYQVLPFAVSIYRYRTVVLKSSPTVHFVIFVQTLVILIFTIYAFLNFPLGENQKNDVCFVLRFSNTMELVRIFSTLFFNFFAIFMNFVILNFVKNFERENSQQNQTKRVQLTKSLLFQSIVPVLVSLPLLLGSFEFYFGIPLPKSFSTTWYATTFLGPFLTPFSSIIGISSTRRELFYTIFRCCYSKKPPAPSTIFVKVAKISKSDRSTFTVRDFE